MRLCHGCGRGLSSRSSTALSLSRTSHRPKCERLSRSGLICTACPRGSVGTKPISKASEMLPARESDLQDGRSWLLVRPGWGRNGTLYEGAITRRGAVRRLLEDRPGRMGDRVGHRGHHAGGSGRQEVSSRLSRGHTHRQRRHDIFTSRSDVGKPKQGDISNTQSSGITLTTWTWTFLLSNGSNI
jgi:hypothetical protein